MYAKVLPLGIHWSLAVLLHTVACHSMVVARNGEAVFPQSIPHVVILPSPLPEKVAVAVHLFEVIHRYRSYAAKDCFVRQSDNG